MDNQGHTKSRKAHSQPLRQLAARIITRPSLLEVTTRIFIVFTLLPRCSAPPDQPIAYTHDKELFEFLFEHGSKSSPSHDNIREADSFFSNYRRLMKESNTREQKSQLAKDFDRDIEQRKQKNRRLKRYEDYVQNKIIAFGNKRNPSQREQIDFYTFILDHYTQQIRKLDKRRVEPTTWRYRQLILKKEKANQKLIDIIAAEGETK